MPKAYSFTKADIENANQMTRSCSAASDYLGCSYNTYKKYAKMYGLFQEQKNQAGLGISKPHNIRNGEYALNDIIDGKYPNYDIGKLKRRLIRNAYMREECEICGFDERRLDDHTVPLILQHKDGNRKNHVFENLQMVCFNCSYLEYGFVPSKKSERTY